MKRLNSNQAQHILDILNEHLRRIEKQMHGTTGELRYQLTRELADTHRTINGETESYL